jgi:hypothetical protein
MFIGRRLDNSLYGCWTSRQPDDADHPRQEEVPDDHPDLLAFLAPKPPDPRVVTDEEEREACKADGTMRTIINQTRAEWAAWAQANFPTLTVAERTRMGVICWLLAVAIRRLMR